MGQEEGEDEAEESFDVSQYLQKKAPATISEQKHGVSVALAKIAKEFGQISRVNVDSESNRRADAQISKILYRGDKAERRRQQEEEEEKVQKSPQKRFSRSGMQNVEKSKRASTAKADDRDGLAEKRKSVKFRSGLSTSSSSSSESDSSDASSSLSSMDSVDADSFDVPAWRKNVLELLQKVSKKDEWDTSAALRQDWDFKDSERAGDFVRIEALAEMRDEEMNNFEAMRGQIETKVEEEQMKILQTLGKFGTDLSDTARNILSKRKKKRNAKKGISFENMKQLDLKALRAGNSQSEEVKEEAVSQKTKKTSASASSVLLQKISEQQTHINDLVRDVTVKKNELEVTREANKHLLKSLETGEDVPDVGDEVKEAMEALQQGMEDAGELDEATEAVASSVDEQTETSAAAMNLPEDLSSQILALDQEIQVLNSQVNELEEERRRRKVQQRKMDQKASSSRRLTMMNAEQSIKLSAEDERKLGEVSNLPALPTDELLSLLSKEIPEAKSIVETLKQNRSIFEESLEKVRVLTLKLSLTGNPPWRVGEEGTGRRKQESQAAAPAFHPDAPAGDGEEAAEGHRSASKAKRSNSKKGNSADASESKQGFSVSSGEATKRHRPSIAGQKVNSMSAEPAKNTNPSPSPEEEAEVVAGATAVDDELKGFSMKLARLQAKLGKALGGAPPQSLQAAASVLEAKNNDLKTKQETLEQLKAEHQKYQQEAPRVAFSTASPATPPTAAAPTKSTADTQALATLLISGLPSESSTEVEATKAPGGQRRRKSIGASSTSSAHLAQPAGIETRRVSRRVSVGKLGIPEESQAASEGSPELIAQLLLLQGENIEIEEQTRCYEDAIRLLRTKGKELSAAELSSVKKNILPDQTSQVEVKKEVQKEKQKLRTLQKTVKEKRQEWQSIDNYTQTLKKLATDQIAADQNSKWGSVAAMLKRVKAATQAQARLDSAGMSREEAADQRRRRSVGGGELMALQASAAIARSDEWKRQTSGDSERSIINLEASASKRGSRRGSKASIGSKDSKDPGNVFDDVTKSLQSLPQRGKRGSTLALGLAAASMAANQAKEENVPKTSKAEVDLDMLAVAGKAGGRSSSKEAAERKKLDFSVVRRSMLKAKIVGNLQGRDQRPNPESTGGLMVNAVGSGASAQPKVANAVSLLSKLRAQRKSLGSQQLGLTFKGLSGKQLDSVENRSGEEKSTAASSNEGGGATAFAAAAGVFLQKLPRKKSVDVEGEERKVRFTVDGDVEGPALGLVPRKSLQGWKMRDVADRSQELDVEKMVQAPEGTEKAS